MRLQVILSVACFAAFGRSAKRDVTPQGLAEELERHLVGNEGSYDWDSFCRTTSGRDYRMVFRKGLESSMIAVSNLLNMDRLETEE